MTQIPLRNRKKEVVAHAIVSEEDFEHLNSYRWYSGSKYVSGVVEGEHLLLHRYVMIYLMKQSIDKGFVVDHINNDPFDNRRENIRILSFSENARNKKCLKNGTSQFRGVSLTSGGRKLKWCVTFNLKGVAKCRSRFHKESWAAHQYNLWLLEYGITSVEPNVISPEDVIGFEEWKPKQYSNEYKCIFPGPHGYSFVYLGRKPVIVDTLEEAIQIRDKVLLDVHQTKEAAFLAQPICRNSEGNAVIIVTKNNIETQVIVDDEDYITLRRMSWNLNRDGYAISTIEGHLQRMHSYLMKSEPQQIVDHNNGNRIDNRKSNLRIVTVQQNNMNRGKTKTKTSSKYIGVRKKSNLIEKVWEATITFDGKQLYLGCFKTEEEAARVRDSKAIEYHGEYARLNFPEEK